MKRSVTIARIIVGVLFIFSGLVKAIDPLGLVYKMQEFFEAWSGGERMNGLLLWLHQDNHALVMAFMMNLFEFVLGVLLLIGWQKKLVSWLLLTLMTFFLFLTAYALFSGKVAECGCFGECIPLSPLQTFVKDVILFILIIFILLNTKYIEPIVKPIHLVGILFLSVIVISLIQSSALEHLPMIDCLPYKKGNDILALRQMPADATFDKYTYSFVYKKGGEEKEFTVNDLPDSTWQFVKQNQTLVEKGNGKLPAINDFSLTDSNGNDSTEAILGQKGSYYLFFVKTMKGDNTWTNQVSYLLQNVQLKKRKFYAVTGDAPGVDSFFNIKNHYNIPVFSCDVTAIKTAARSTPTLFLMDGPVVQGKWAWLDIEEGLQ